MFKDRQFIKMKNGQRLERFEECLREWSGRVIYVVDAEDRVIGCFDVRELKRSKAERKVIYNECFKYIKEGEEDRAGDIFAAYRTIREIPVLDEKGRILYCYRKDGREEMKAVIENLRMRGVTIGEDVYIYDSNIDGRFGWLITIGSHVTISCATILSHDASMRKGIGYTKLGKVEIGDNCFIGYGSIILPDVKIGNKVVVGAGTVVAKDIPDNSVVIGNPMRSIGTYDDYIEKNKEMSETMQILQDDRGMSMTDKRLLAETIGSVIYLGA